MSKYNLLASKDEESSYLWVRISCSFSDDEREDVFKLSVRNQMAESFQDLSHCLPVVLDLIFREVCSLSSVKLFQLFNQILSFPFIELN